MKPPKINLGKWRSIEFECIFYSKKHLTDFRSFIRDHNYKRYITIKDDSSIRVNRDGVVRRIKANAQGLTYWAKDFVHITKEIVLTYCSGNEKIVRDVCGFLKTKAYVNKTCGAQVHFDMRHVNRDTVVLYGAKLAICIDALKQLVPHWRRSNYYCSGSMTKMGRYDNRYRFINLHAYEDHKTIEVRGHSGTLDGTKILNWIAICEGIMFSDKQIKAKNAKELISGYKFNKTLSTYITNRQKQLARKTYNATMET